MQGHHVVGQLDCLLLSIILFMQLFNCIDVHILEPTLNLTTDASNMAHEKTLHQTVIITW